MKFNYHNPHARPSEDTENEQLAEELQYDIAKYQSETIERDDYDNELEESLDDLLERREEPWMDNGNQGE